MHIARNDYLFVYGGVVNGEGNISNITGSRIWVSTVPFVGLVPIRYVNFIAYKGVKPPNSEMAPQRGM